MTAKRILVSCGVATALISSSAFAADATRSSIPSIKASNVFGSRAFALKQKKSQLQEVGDTTDMADGRYVIAGGAVIVVVAGIIIAIDNKDNVTTTSSPG